MLQARPETSCRVDDKSTSLIVSTPLKTYRLPPPPLHCLSNTRGLTRCVCCLRGTDRTFGIDQGRKRRGWPRGTPLTRRSASTRYTGEHVVCTGYVLCVNDAHRTFRPASLLRLEPAGSFRFAFGRCSLAKKKKAVSSVRRLRSRTGGGFFLFRRDTVRTRIETFCGLEPQSKRSVDCRRSTHGQREAGAGASSNGTDKKKSDA